MTKRFPRDVTNGATAVHGQRSVQHGGQRLVRSPRKCLGWSMAAFSLPSLDMAALHTPTNSVGSPSPARSPYVQRKRECDACHRRFVIIGSPVVQCEACKASVCTSCLSECMKIGNVEVTVCITCFAGPPLTEVDSSLVPSPSAPPAASPRSSITSVPVAERVLPAVQRADNREFTYVSAPVLAGSTPSRGIFSKGGKLYYGKAEVVDSIAESTRLALTEICANDIYGFFGCAAQRLWLSDQEWLPGSEKLAAASPINHGIHLMCEWIDGFSEFGPQLVTQLESGVPVLWDGLPVNGLGHILAVAMLLHDVDCVGALGANVGYTVVKGPDNEPTHVNAVKIDPGYALRFDMDHVTAGGSKRAQRLLDKQIAVIRSGELFISSGKRIRIGSLDDAVVEEFRASIRDMCDVDEAMIRGWFARPGMESLFTTDEIAALVQYIDRRRRVMCDTFPTVLMGGPSSVQECSALLKSRYESCNAVRDPVTGLSVPIGVPSINIVLLHFRGGSVATNSSTRSSLFDSESGRRLLSVCDVFQMCTGATKRVTLVGGAGYGKSTACQSIVCQWREGWALQEYSAVFLVPLQHLSSDRYPSGNTYDMLDILIRECFGCHPTRSLRKVTSLYIQSGLVLWILDGYDEVFGRLPPHLLAAFEQLLSTPHHILMGRPSVVTPSNCDAVVELVGFSDGDVGTYVESFARLHDESAHPSAILRALQSNSLLWELCHVPINIALLCHVLSIPSDTVAYRPHSVTSIYQRIEWLMLRRHAIRVGDAAPVRPTQELPASVRGVKAAVCQLALHACRTGTAVLTLTDVERILDMFKDDPTVTLASVQSCGLLIIVGDALDQFSLTSSSMSFLHQTFLEYYAAVAIVEELSRGYSTENELQQWLRANKYCNQLELVWVFVAGIVGSSICDTFQTSVALDSFARLWKCEPRDLGTVIETRLWLRMCEEGAFYSLPVSNPDLFCSDMCEMARVYLARLLSGLPTRSAGGWASVLTECPSFLQHVITTDSEIQSQLTCALASEQYELRQAAVRLVCGLRDMVLSLDPVVDWLVHALDDDRFGHRIMALHVFSRLGISVFRSVKLVNWMKTAVDCTRDDVSLSAVRAIAQLGDAAIDLDWVTQWLTRELDRPCVSRATASYLKMLGPHMLRLKPVLPSAEANVKVFGGLRQKVGSDVLCSVGPSLLELPWVSDWIHHYFTSSTLLLGGDTLRIVNSFGTRCLEMGWLSVWLEQSMCAAGDLYRWKCVGKVLISLGPSMLRVECVVSWLGMLLSVDTSVSHRHLKQPLLLGLQTLSHAGAAIVEHPSLVTAVLNTLSCTVDEVQVVALQVLIGPGAPYCALSHVVAPLVRIISRGRTYVRPHAIRYLTVYRQQVLDYPLAVKCLEPCVTSVDAAVRSASHAWLSTLGPKVVRISWLPTVVRDVLLTPSSHSAIRISVMDMLLSLAPHLESVLSVELARLARSDDAALCVFALSIVSSIGLRCLRHPWVLSTLEAWSVDALPVRRVAVIDTLQCFGVGVLDRPRLRALLEKGVVDDDMDVQCAAFRALTALGPSILSHSLFVTALTCALSASSPLVRQHARSTLQSVFAACTSSHDPVCVQCCDPAVLSVAARVVAIVLEPTSGTLSLFTHAGVCLLPACPPITVVGGDEDGDDEPSDPCEAMSSLDRVLSGASINKRMCLDWMQVGHSFIGHEGVIIAMLRMFIRVCESSDSNRMVLCDSIVPQLLDLLLLYTASLPVQSSACVLISTLCRHSSVTVALSELGAFDWIVGAIHCHWSAPTLVSPALQLTLQDPEPTSVDNLIGLIQRHGDNAPFAASCWDAMSQLCLSEQSRDRLYAIDGLPALYHSMHLHALDEPVAAAACSVLVAAVRSDDILTHVCMNGGLEPLLEVTRAHLGTSKPVMDSFVKLLGCTLPPGGNVLVLASDAIEMLLFIGQRSPRVAILVRDALQQFTAGVTVWFSPFTHVCS